MFVPGASVNAAVQLLQPLAVAAGFQPAPLSWQKTLAMDTEGAFSRAVPVTVKTVLLQRWPFSGDVMLSDGAKVWPGFGVAAIQLTGSFA